MTDVGAVVAYLGALAEQDTAFKPHVGSVVFADMHMPPSQSKLNADELQRLGAIDLLHKEEQLIREGMFWLIGKHDDVEYRWPIRQRRVSLGSTSAIAMHSIGGQLGRQEGPWQLSPGLIDQPELRHIALADHIWAEEFHRGPGTPNDPSDPQKSSIRHALEDLLDDSPIPIPPMPKELQDRFLVFLRGYLKEAGLPQLEVRGFGQSGSNELHLLFARGFFLERHPFELNRASALKLWRDRDLSGTVLAALYDDADLEVQAPHRSILSPLPLNASQRQAIETTRQSPVTIVSGPPGTGKSHLVAAAAIDQVASGRSVLVASQTVHARDAVIDLLERYPMVEALRFGDDASARRIGDKLAAGVGSSSEADTKTVREQCFSLEAGIRDHRERILRRIVDLAGFEDALIRRHDVPLWLAHADLDAIDVTSCRNAMNGLDGTGLMGWIRRRSAQKTIRTELGDRALADREAVADLLDAVAAEQLVNAVAGRNLGLDDMWVELDRRQEQWRQTIGDLVDAERRERSGKKSRQALQQLASALRLSPLKRREELASIGNQFLDVLPLWVGTLGEIEALLPVESGLFDLVILDEASQISQMSAVPALARARRALIVGDSRQLRHISFVSDAAQAEAAEAFAIPQALRSRLNDRTNSIFDAAAAVAPAVELDEHFRCAPHIIGFSQRQFYDGHLRLMTQHPRNEARDAIQVVTVAGTRDEQRVVTAEVIEVMRLVRELIASGTESIGVVSPFRAQADALEAAILDALHLDEIAGHRYGSEPRTASRAPNAIT